jgi:hypothetical protein
MKVKGARRRDTDRKSMKKLKVNRKNAKKKKDCLKQAVLFPPLRTFSRVDVPKDFKLSLCLQCA